MDRGRVAQVVCAALSTGAKASGQTRMAAAVSAAMRALWETLARRLGGDLAEVMRAEIMLVDVDPAAVERCTERVRARLQGLSVVELQEIVVRAQAVLAVTDPHAMASGRYANAGQDGVDVASGDASAADGQRMRRVAFGSGDPGRPDPDPARWLIPIGRANRSAASPPDAGQQHRPEASALADAERPPAAESFDTHAARVALSLGSRPSNQLAAIVRIEQRCFADVEQRLGPDHVDTIAARLSLADVYRWAGRTTDALAALERVVTDRERLLGTDHPDAVAARARLRGWRGDAQ